MIGETISHYRILRPLGSGGGGDVYLAEDLRLGRKVALKFVAQDLARDREALRRFESEARAAAELSHSHIAGIYDFDEADGRRFLALEYLEGETLRDRVGKGPLPIDEVLRIGKALAGGLEHAHAKGIVHRDIKGANVMLTTDGGVKILDFGLARHVDATHVTRTGAIVGTVSYMSPEQVQGKEADARSDLWSLGVVLYECLTGTRPFEGESSQSVMHGIASTSPPPPTALRTGIPLELERVVLRCLEKDPALRYQHADDLVAELRRIESRTSESVPSAHVTHAGAKTRWKRIALAVAAVAVVVTVLGVLQRGWIPGRGGVPEEPEAEPSVALVDVRDLSNPEDPMPGAIMTNLLEVGLIEASPCRVVSLNYLKDLRRRMFGATRGPIESSEALEVARAAGATSLLLCDLAETEGLRSLLWRLVDTASGEALGARRVEGGQFADLVDGTVSGVLPLLAAAVGAEVSPPASVREVTTASPEAYRHYAAGKLAMDRDYEDAWREFSKAIETDSTFALAHLELAGVGEWGAGERDRSRESLQQAWTFRDRLGAKNRLRLEALRAISRGKPADQAEAIEIYREILSRWPDDRDAIVELSDVLSKFWQAGSEEVFALAQRGIALYPDDMRMLGLYEDALCRAGRPEESIAAIRDYMRRHPEATDLVGNIGGTFLYYMAEPDSAEPYFEQARALQPENLWHWSNLTKCAYMRGDVKEAIRRGERTRELGKTLDPPQVYPSTAFLHADIGQIERAFELVEEAEQYASGPMELRSILIAREDLRLRTGRAQEVLDDVGEPFYENYRTTRIVRAWALAAVGSVDAAIALVDSLKSEPGAANAWWAYYIRKAEAEIALAQGKPEETLDILLPERPGHYELERRKVIVRAYLMLGRHSEAEEALREILRWYGGHALAHYELGQVLEKTRRDEEAEAEYERFLEMWSDADEGLPQLVDARERLAALRARPSP